MKSENGKKGLIFTGMGFELVALILGGQMIGEVLDKKYSLGGMGQAGMIFLVMAGWMYHLIVMLKQFMNTDDKNGPAK